MYLKSNEQIVCIKFLFKLKLNIRMNDPFNIFNIGI